MFQLSFLRSSLPLVVNETYGECSKEKLVKKLDTIHFGSMKMNVNISKFYAQIVQQGSKRPMALWKIKMGKVGDEAEIWKGHRQVNANACKCHLWYGWQYGPRPAGRPVSPPKKGGPKCTTEPANPFEPGPPSPPVRRAKARASPPNPPARQLSHYTYLPYPISFPRESRAIAKANLYSLNPKSAISPNLTGATASPDLTGATASPDSATACPPSPNRGTTLKSRALRAAPPPAFALPSRPKAVAPFALPRLPPSPYPHDLKPSRHFALARLRAALTTQSRRGPSRALPPTFARPHHPKRRAIHAAPLPAFALPSRPKALTPRRVSTIPKSVAPPPSPEPGIDAAQSPHASTLLNLLIFFIAKQ
ncbi:hypothetical protein Fmac_024176 [Flemingia macrophylla]|uniref:Uncharacterized protein n=1 Tax=Flemingia macrophylla TaxID=520843 RepID=A0ABD1LNS5_9FABA